MLLTIKGRVTTVLTQQAHDRLLKKANENVANQRKQILQWRQEIRHRGPAVKITPCPLPFNLALHAHLSKCWRGTWMVRDRLWSPDIDHWYLHNMHIQKTAGMNFLLHSPLPREQKRIKSYLSTTIRRMYRMAEWGRTIHKSDAWGKMASSVFRRSAHVVLWGNQNLSFQNHWAKSVPAITL